MPRLPSVLPPQVNGAYMLGHPRFLQALGRLPAFAGALGTGFRLWGFVSFYDSL